MIKYKMYKYKMYNKFYSFEAGIKKGKKDQKDIDISILEKARIKFNLDKIIISKIIRKIKSGEI